MKGHGTAETGAATGEKNGAILQKIGLKHRTSSDNRSSIVAVTGKVSL
jgi:hypothetical protein